MCVCVCSILDTHTHTHTQKEREREKYIYYTHPHTHIIYIYIYIYTVQCLSAVTPELRPQAVLRPVILVPINPLINLNLYVCPILRSVLNYGQVVTVPKVSIL